MKKMIALVVAFFVQSATAQTLSRVKPAEVGLSAERLGRITQLLRDDTTKGLVPGAVLLVARHGKIAWFESVGVLDPATKAPMTNEAIFRIYSMSKPITTVSAMLLFEEGKFSLSDPIAKYLPQFARMQVGVPKADPAGGKPTLDLVPARRP